jgi:hypothetical protein
MKFRAPNEESERIYNESYAKICSRYSAYLDELGSDKFKFENSDLDTGHKIHAGEYELVDEAYYKLLRKQDKKNFEHLTPALKSSLLAYYENAAAKKVYAKHPHKWRKITDAIEEMKTKNASLQAVH